MSGMVRPKGGAPPSVYWRRRLVLLAVVLLVAAGLVKVLGGGDDDTPTATETTEPESQQSTNDDEKPRKRKKRGHDGAADATAGERDVSVTFERGGSCDPASVTVTPSLAPESYAGRNVAVRLAFTTSGDQPCVLSLDEHEPLVSISDGADLVWESTRCADLFGARSVRLEPGWLTYVDADWSGRASGRTCGDTADYADAGEYEVQAAVVGGEPSSAKVSLEPEPEQESNDDESDKDDKPDRDDKSDDDRGDKSEDGGSSSQDQGDTT